jgi:peptide deformylase
MLDECGQERILLLGDPGLRKVCEPVADLASQAFQRNGRRLLRALEQFRSEHGFGRGIAAPQIGILERMIALNLGEGPFLVVNPVLTLKSDRRFTLWDDCMSFPWLMVRLERYSEIEMDFFSQTG